MSINKKDVFEYVLQSFCLGVYKINNLGIQPSIYDYRAGIVDTNRRISIKAKTITSAKVTTKLKTKKKVNFLFKQESI